jgi:Domain of unknown function (DUF5666)
MKQKTYLISGVCVATLALCLSLTAQTMPKKPASTSASPNATASPTAPPAKSARGLPMHGMISAVDQNAKTFTIASKEKSNVFKVTDKTVITKGANAATMKDIVENEEVRVSYWKNADGSLEAKTVKLGPKEKAKTSTVSPTASPKASASPKP